jgi:hypothetical protein
MAIRFIEGFEIRQIEELQELLYTYSGASITAASGRLHGTAWSGANSSMTTPALVSSVEDVWVVHFAFRKQNATAISGAPGITFFDGTDAQLELRAVAPASPNASGYQWELMRGATVLATSPVYPFGSGARAWNVFQLKVTIDPSAGTYELKRFDYDGAETTEIAEATGENTADQGTAGADRVRLSIGTAGTSIQQLDDVVILDGTGGALDDFFAAPVTVVGELPNGAGNSSDFIPSSAAPNYQMVDDSPTAALGTDEVTSANIGDVDLYQFSQADLDLLPTTSPPDVHGVQVVVQGEMKNAGTANLRVEVRDGSNQATDAKDLDFSGSARTSRFAVLPENPTGTPAPWTVGDLTTIEVGVRYSS